jgi:hypothetical protein
MHHVLPLTGPAGAWLVRLALCLWPARRCLTLDRVLWETPDAEISRTRARQVGSGLYPTTHLYAPLQTVPVTCLLCVEGRSIQRSYRLHHAKSAGFSYGEGQAL